MTIDDIVIGSKWTVDQGAGLIGLRHGVRYTIAGKRWHPSKTPPSGILTITFAEHPGDLYDASILDTCMTEVRIADKLELI